MQSPLHESATGTTMTLRALARFPDRMAFVWDGGSLTYRGALDLIGRLQAAMVGGRRAQGPDRGVPQRQQCGDLVRRRRRPGPGIDRHLAASAGRARRSPRGHRGCRGIGADRRSQDACPTRRRACRQGRAPRDRAHHGQGGFRTRRDGGGRQDRRGDAGRSHQRRRLRDHQLHRRHDRQVQGRDPAASVERGIDAGDRGRLRVSRGAALSRGGAHHPRLGHQGDARAAARRHGASPEGLRAGKIPGHHRAREDQLHADGADDDLRAARSSEARADRPVLAGADPVRRLADVADAARRGAGAHRPGVQPALRPDGMLSRERSRAGPTTTPAGPSCSPRAASPSPRAASACATTTTTR